MMKVDINRKPKAVKGISVLKEDKIAYINLKVNQDFNNLTRKELNDISTYILKVMVWSDEDG